ncbi:Hypothetical protein A7982_04290 [Minicystis rosea]|nr:Hypothetical protein A7982_04290 [Minicystis rosea]
MRLGPSTRSSRDRDRLSSNDLTIGPNALVLRAFASAAAEIV